jgi:flavin-dependent dehydrogenase
MVRRDLFDHFLVRRAADQGALVRDGTAWTALRPDREGWTVELAEGPPLRARYLVAADGALGRAPRSLGFPPLKHAVAGALEGETPWAMTDTATAHLDFGTISRGYLWNFPKAEGWSLGGGVFRGSARVDLRGVVDQYALAFGLAREDLRVAAHPLHLWDGRQDLHGHRSLLAGEAACLVDPFTGVGILPAVMSGVLAAQAVHAALAAGPEALSGYTREVHRHWGREMV